MTFFNNTKSYEENKALYKKLCFENHPDKGGDVETMQAINAEWESLIIKGFENIECILSDKLNFAIDLNVEVELCGTWIWVSGDTKPVKDKLKAEGFFWAFKKKMWYFREEENKKTYRKGSMDIDDIRATYGSKNYTRGKRQIGA